MSRLLALLVLVVLAVGLAMVLQLDWGNVTLWLPPYRVDMTLQTAVLGLLGALGVTLIIARVIAGVIGIPERVRRFRRRRLQETRLRTLSDAVVNYREGRFARAIKSAAIIADDTSLASDVPAAQLAASAIAASAAHQLHDTALRDAWVSRASGAAAQDEAKTLAALLEAEFAVDDRRGGRALSALAPLTKGDRRHVHTLRLQLKASLLERRWDEVLRLTRLLENRKALNTVGALQYKREIAKAWIETNRHDEARRLIEATLKTSWDSGLAMLYGRVQGNALDQLTRLEQWLIAHPMDAELNWSLGRICQRQKLWGKARMHLEASLRAKPMVATHLALAEIAEALAEKETAALHWKAAAQLTA
ncbi:MAG: Protoporphyrinogen oxidase [Pseudomonadota bacterium]